MSPSLGWNHGNSCGDTGQEGACCPIRLDLKCKAVDGVPQYLFPVVYLSPLGVPTKTIYLTLDEQLVTGDVTDSSDCPCKE